MSYQAVETDVMVRWRPVSVTKFTVGSRFPKQHFVTLSVFTFQRVRTSTLRVGQPNGIQFNFNFGLGHFLANATTDNALPIGER